MEQKIDIKLIVIIILVILVGVAYFLGKNGSVISVKSEFSGIENTLKEIEKDAYFYQNFTTFSALFNNEDSKYFKDFGKKMEDEKFIEKKLSLVMLAGIFEKDPKIKEMLEGVKNIYNKNKLSDKEKEEIFSKNNDCAKLVADIKDGLKNKYKNSYGTTEKEEFGFIFYSPTLKTCVYSTNYDYSYNSGEKYYTKASKIVYNASVQSKIDEFNTYAYEHPYVKEDDVERGKKLYIKFILENSGYNADLLKDFSYGMF